MAEIKNRELSQFSSFLHVDNISENIGIASDATPYIGIGTFSPTEKVHVVGNVRVVGFVTATNAIIDNLDVINATVSSGTVTLISGSSLNYTGVGTIATLNGTSLNYTGISTVSGVKIQSGIITAANTGIVTYYGDGQYLVGTISGVGINSGGSLIGYGATTINFVGSGVSAITFNASAGIATVNIRGAEINATNTQVLFNRAGIITGSANFTFDGSALVSVAGTVSATNFNTTSDLNFKENVTTFENALDVVLQLRGVRFDWKETHSPSVGVIAQELEEVLPELVTQTDPKTVNYNGIIGVLIEAIKELQEEIQELKNAK